MRKLLFLIAILTLTASAVVNAGCGTSSTVSPPPPPTSTPAVTPPPTPTPPPTRPRTPTPTPGPEVITPSLIFCVVSGGVVNCHPLSFSASEGGCDPSSFTAHSENPLIAGVSGNDGFGNFKVFGQQIVHLSSTYIDVTDCHGFTTSPSSTPASVTVKVNPGV